MFRFNRSIPQIVQLPFASCATTRETTTSEDHAGQSSADDGAGNGSSVAISVKAALNVGGVAPPTMSVPMRDQSGSSAASRIQLCKSVKPAGNEEFGRSPDSQ